MLEGKNLDTSFKVDLNLRVDASLAGKSLTSNFKAQIDQVHPADLSDLDCKDFILLRLLVSLAQLHLCADLANFVSCTNGQSQLNVIEREELFDSLGRAWGTNKLVQLCEVCKLGHRFLALPNLIHLFKDEAGGLLGHNRISTLKRREGCDIRPPVREARGQEEASSTTRLTHFVHPIVTHLSRKRLDSGR